jgi:hypothetical protein
MVNQPVARTFTEADGRFEFPVVPQGRYVVRVVDFPDIPRGAVVQSANMFSIQSMDPAAGRPPLVEAPTYWAETAVDVIDRDATVDLTLHEGARIRGRVAFNMTGSPPSSETRSMMPVVALSASDAMDESFQAARIEADGTFTTVALPPGEYGIMTTGFPFTQPGGLRTIIESILTGARDVAGLTLTLSSADLSGVVVTLTDKAPYVSGTVIESRELVTFGAQVVVFPADERQWFSCGPFASRFVIAVADSDGSFRTWPMPPGEYLVAALVGGEDDWFNPEFLRTLVPYATRLKLALGDHPTVTLKPRPRR